MALSFKRIWFFTALILSVGGASAVLELRFLKSRENHHAFYLDIAKTDYGGSVVGPEILKVHPGRVAYVQALYTEYLVARRLRSIAKAPSVNDIALEKFNESRYKQALAWYTQVNAALNRTRIIRPGVHSAPTEPTNLKFHPTAAQRESERKYIRENNDPEDYAKVEGMFLNLFKKPILTEVAETAYYFPGSQISELTRVILDLLAERTQSIPKGEEQKKCNVFDPRKVAKILVGCKYEVVSQYLTYFIAGIDDEGKRSAEYIEAKRKFEEVAGNISNSFLGRERNMVKDTVNC